MPRNWKYVGGEIAPLPGFPLHDVTDDELKAACDAYASRFPDASAVSADVYAVVTGKSRVAAAYVAEGPKAVKAEED